MSKGLATKLLCLLAHDWRKGPFTAEQILFNRTPDAPWYCARCNPSGQTQPER